ncbi:MAG: GTP-binding protein [Ruminococcaceae bacterium]|nr:GTP-binding protein [Oscillospiraceae bacterium]
MKRIVIGMLAHVDSGKTTLSEALLFKSGSTRKLGRVDHGDAFLDTDSMERNRGITIFSKQAVINYADSELVLLDTPGHIDFSAEMERTLQVLDYAVLVISGTDGVQSHTETLWQLLIRYNIPTFIFINKMDISFLAKESLMKELKKRLSSGCVCFDGSSEFGDISEELAECSEDMMNSYLDSGEIRDEDIVKAIKDRKVFPCCFGSALKLQGIDSLLNIIDKYAVAPIYPESFGAKIFKITRDEQGGRLTHLKITGGSLKVRSVISGADWQEKINQIRVYSGEKFTAFDELPAGCICAVTGLSKTYAGEGLGNDSNTSAPLLEPVLTYKLLLPPKADPQKVLPQMRILEEQDPQLHVVWNEQHREISVQLMGEIQLEILKTMISERFGLDVDFDRGSISYKETIAAPVLGMGHYEPLRHYAEVQLLMEPAERGTGLQFGVELQRDSLDINWQRLVLTHLEEKTHIGALTGSPITDMKITLVAGKAHLKHTEGGDFRQATYRAVRQGLRSAAPILLEPWYDFKLDIPSDCVGRALTDLQRMESKDIAQITTETGVTITGSAPVSEMRDYQTELMNYTRGKGRISCIAKGFFPCHNPDEVVAAIGYDADSDIDNTADSVFCSHGAGVNVNWQEAPSRMHCDSGIRFGGNTEQYDLDTDNIKLVNSYKQRMATDKELMEIFERTYGKIDSDPRRAMRREKELPRKIPKLPALPKGPEYLLVDGYNIIFAWDELNRQARENLDLARNSLINILCNYQGFRQCNLILVFDAYKVKGNHREVETVGGISVVYTKEAETADMYIEKVSRKLGKDHRVRVATSDNVEQLIILGSGGIRISAAEFYEEVKLVEKAIRDIIES